MMPRKTLNRLRLVFEELCVQTLIPTLLDPFTLRFSAAYNEKDDTVEVTLTYSGELNDPFVSADELSMSILRGFVKRHEHSYENGMNRLIMAL